MTRNDRLTVCSDSCVDIRGIAVTSQLGENQRGGVKYGPRLGNIRT